MSIAFAVTADDAPPSAFFQPALRFSLALLNANHRDEAGRSSRWSRAKRAALLRVRSIEWDKFPYSVILVPGQGPDEPNVALSPKARLLLEAVAKRFGKGKRPSSWCRVGMYILTRRLIARPSK